MTVLILDTAQGLCTVALGQGGQVVASRSEPMTRGHQERLPVLVEAVLAEAGLGASALSVVAATRGPGSFTGLRVGLAFAQGLAAATGARGLGLSSLEALAVQAILADPDGDSPLAAVMDARRGQVYLALWGGPEGRLPGTPIQPPTALCLADAEAMLAPHRPRAIGSGAALVEGGVAEVHVVDGPDPAALVHLATALANASSATGLEPLYLRAPDATPPTRLPGQPRPDRA
ncbi:tRNA (adenosine(37)-N6)-threonylcarbamoyltransferase complex dimerization subunit type 1 TsaB [Brevundimonas sp. A19_0]|uniref:tRNA (adenosine(37)-N6)-threonylcarbamoyltransferase complex dimerization subunit type 1 TsaB n=1 Tax=Brevundimonas sp. A19_0 TaxID=2821087 RepID=UPI001AD9D59F|nr:tRNA (adenosine(37)-N6)-threonylcarbamoyltransferase complex dimerization subunit type 1 TsaB [Brevundimonas sp. A19_0]MBO9501257.1 tRNA (adenosine(37)-N6)-threonylcarbamoyltransferase complex dimerization subunit type 1 TsaB [Brevundimonas sp. A19_0]